MAEPNFANRTVWTADCLYVLRGMNSESVDLIYLDPPFNSKADYSAPIGSKAAGAAFKDTWSLSDVDAEWVNLIEARHPALYRVLLAAMTDSDKSYLAYMAARLIEMRRVLKPTGSVYLHCDPTMSHYLKLLMDAVFGRAMFRNEVVWKRSARSDGKRFGWTHDILLGYAGPGATWNDVFVPLDADHVRRFYRERDKRGRYQRDNLTGPGTTEGESGASWRGTDPTDAGRCWSVPRSGAYARWIEETIIPGYRSEPSPLARLDLLAEADMIHWPKTGKGWPRLKRYLAASPGRRVNDVFDDIRPVSNLSREQVGYPTQKPLKLLDRIIRASSNPGDLILDPFCGCATACVAAETADREWLGIDLSPKAVELVRHRLADHHGVFGQIIARTDIPRRTDLGKLPAPAKHRTVLYGLQSGDCAGCGEHFRAKHLEVDHIIARAKGGTDHVENLQLLCGHCNKVKGDRGMAYLRTKLQLGA